MELLHGEEKPAIAC